MLNLNTENNIQATRRGRTCLPPELLLLSLEQLTWLDLFPCQTTSRLFRTVRQKQQADALAELKGISESDIADKAKLEQIKSAAKSDPLRAYALFYEPATCAFLHNHYGYDFVVEIADFHPNLRSQIYSLAGNAAVDRGDYHRAGQWKELDAQLDPEKLIQQGNTAVDRGDYHRAGRWQKLDAQLDPEKLTQQGNAAVDRGDYHRAGQWKELDAQVGSRKTYTAR
jgi:hypothetical protein